MIIIFLFFLSGSLPGQHFLLILSPAVSVSSDVRRFKMFTDLYTCWNSGHSFNMSSWLFPVQRHPWCILQDYSAGWLFQFLFMVLLVDVCMSSQSSSHILLDVREFFQEGYMRLWRGTNAGLALAVPTVHSLLKWDLKLLVNLLEIRFDWFMTSWQFYLRDQVGIYLPCYDIFRNSLEELTSQRAPTLMPYVPLLAGSLARSLACASCYPIELARTRMQVLIIMKSLRSRIESLLTSMGLIWLWLAWYFYGWCMAFHHTWYLVSTSSNLLYLMMVSVHN